MKKGLLLVITLCILIIGCSTNVKLKNIDEELFGQAESVDVMVNYSRYGYRMSKEQIDILRNSILQSESVEEILEDDYEKEATNCIIVIIIKKRNRVTVNIDYNLDSGHLYIRKIDTYKGDPRKIMMDRNKYKKHLEGAYKIKPSGEFEELTKFLESKY